MYQVTPAKDVGSIQVDDASPGDADSLVEDQVCSHYSATAASISSIIPTLLEAAERLRRASYVTPLRLYLLFAIPFFFVLERAVSPDRYALNTSTGST